MALTFAAAGSVKTQRLLNVSASMKKKHRRRRDAQSVTQLYMFSTGCKSLDLVVSLCHCGCLVSFSMNLLD